MLKSPIVKLNVPLHSELYANIKRLDIRINPETSFPEYQNHSTPQSTPIA